MKLVAKPVHVPVHVARLDVKIACGRKKRGSIGGRSVGCAVGSDLLLFFNNLFLEVAKAVDKTIIIFASDGFAATVERFRAGDNLALRLDSSIVDVLPADGLVGIGRDRWFGSGCWLGCCEDHEFWHCLPV